MNDLNRQNSIQQTRNLAPGYERRLIEAGMPAQGTEARALARAIARWDGEAVPMNLIERRLYQTYFRFVQSAGLDRNWTGAIGAIAA